MKAQGRLPGRFSESQIVAILKQQDKGQTVAQIKREHGSLAAWSIDFEKASRAESQRGFVPVAKRWVVERSISWTNYFRRLVKDYEYTLSSAVNWLYLANIQIMLQRMSLKSDG